MNSPFANLFLSIQQRIAAITTPLGNSQVGYTFQVGNGNPTFKYIDQDLGQLESHNGDNKPPVLWPCVLIDFDGFSFENLSSNAQTVQGLVMIRIGFPPFSGTQQNTPIQYKEKALQFYDQEFAVHQALQGWCPDGDFGALIRTNAVTEKREDFIRVRVITYSIAWQDYATVKKTTFVPATLNLDTQY